LESNILKPFDKTGRSRIETRLSSRTIAPPNQTRQSPKKDFRVSFVENMFYSFEF
jgi:hypothetical protein